MHSFFVISLLGHLAMVQLSIGIPLRLKGPSDIATTADANIVKQAATDAHQQIVNVQNVLQQPHQVAHPHLVNAFGPDYNYAAIKHNMDVLEDGRVLVSDPRARKDGYDFHGLGTTNPDTKHIAFGTTFFTSQNPSFRAGTMVHEATHALLGTVDSHTLPGQDRTVNGYRDSDDFERLKQTNSHNMHTNADSYRVLAHTCTNGLNAPLVGRALAETDPVKREYLFQRAGKVCSLPSSAQKKQKSPNPTARRKAIKSTKRVKKGVRSAKSGLVGPKAARKVARKASRKAVRKAARKAARRQGKVPAPHHKVAVSTAHRVSQKLGKKTNVPVKKNK